MEEHFSPEKFIELVKPRESIWNYTSKAYSNKLQRRNDWLAVCEEMLPNFHELSDAEKGANVLELQTKWRVMRDGFTRSLKNYRENRKKGHRGKLYARYEQLSFLNDLYGNIERDIETPLEINDVKRKKRQRLAVKPKSSEKSDENESQAENIVSRVPSPRLPNPRMPRVPGNRKVSKMNVVSESALEEDKMFLLSLLTDFRNIPEDQKLNAKSDIINVIRHYRCVSPTQFQTNFVFASTTSQSPNNTNYYDNNIEFNDSSRDTDSPPEVKFRSSLDE